MKSALWLLLIFAIVVAGALAVSAILNTAAHAEEPPKPPAPITISIEDRQRFALIESNRNTLRAQLASLDEMERNLRAEACDRAGLRISECEWVTDPRTQQPTGEIRKRAPKPVPPAKPEVKP